MAREGKDHSVLLHFTPTRIYNFFKNYFYMFSPIHTHFYYMISHHICCVLKYRFFFLVAFLFLPGREEVSPHSLNWRVKGAQGNQLQRLGYLQATG